MWEANLFRLVWLFALSHSAFACTCISLEEGSCGSAKSASSIFTGRVTAVETVGDRKIFTFRILTPFRGAVQNETVRVSTWADGGSCGADFEKNSQYLIYANEQDGSLATYLCSGNRLLSEAAADLSYLKTMEDARRSTTAYVFGYVSSRKPDPRHPGSPSWPATGIKVWAVGPTSIQEAVTGTDGFYDFPFLAPGKYRIAAEPEGVYDLRRGHTGLLDARAGSCGFAPFARIRYAVLEGTLLDAEGEPDDSSDLFLDPIGATVRPPQPGEDTELQTDTRDGKFRFEVPPGRYRLSFREMGYLARVPYPQEVVLSEGAPAQVHFQLPKQPVQLVKGKVVGATGTPASRVQVSVSGDAPDGSHFFGSVVTGPDGVFEFELMPLEYELKAVGCSPDVVAKAIVTKGQIKPVLLTLPSSARTCGSK